MKEDVGYPKRTLPLCFVVPLTPRPPHPPSLPPSLHVQDAQYGIRLADGNIKQLSNLKANRERRFREHYRDNAEVAIKVRDWAAHNADKLRGPVSGPIALEVGMGVRLRVAGIGARRRVNR